MHAFNDALFFPSGCCALLGAVGDTVTGRRGLRVNLRLPKRILDFHMIAGRGKLRVSVKLHGIHTSSYIRNTLNTNNIYLFFYPTL